MDPVAPVEITTAELAAPSAPAAVGISPTALIEVVDAHNRTQSRYRLATPGSTCKIGRSVACDIVLDDPYAAPEHTAIALLADGRVSISDLGSRNGTRL